MHPIDILKGEHEEILKTIDLLESMIEKITSSKDIKQTEKQISNLKYVNHVFEEAELHHKKEEDVLFPLIEKHGVEGPTQVMRMEHEELRKRKAELRECVKNYKKLKFNEFVSKVEENGNFIVSVLRDHIGKENNILYPMSMEIAEEKEWKDVRKKFDKIGYCCFSPKDK